MNTLNDFMYSNNNRIISYENFLREIQGYISNNHSSIFASNINSDDDATKEKLCDIISKYIGDNKIKIDDYDDVNPLIEAIYNDMSQYGVITPYLNDDIEEANINSFSDAEVITKDRYFKLQSAYASSQQAEDMAKKMLRAGDVTIDETNPLGDSYIKKGVRVSAIIYPCVDKDVGAAISIRKQRMVNITREQYLEGDSATDYELNMISDFLRFGISVAFTGATDSGKTTDMGYFLKQIPNNKRIFVIEDTRELDLVKRDANGKIINRVIHTKTTDTAGLEKLMRVSLRFNPYCIVPAEMRDESAMIAQELGRTGHVIVTNLHADEAIDGYSRILSMCCMSGTKISENMLLDMIIKAFPIMVFKRKLEDGSRRFMEIFEAEGHDHGVIKGRYLYRYNLIDNVYADDGTIQIIGRHEKGEPISDRLAKKMLEAGASRKIITKYADENFINALTIAAQEATIK
jgi:pilus assembly protein CpaF